MAALLRKPHWPLAHASFCRTPRAKPGRHTHAGSAPLGDRDRPFLPASTNVYPRHVYPKASPVDLTSITAPPGDRRGWGVDRTELHASGLLRVFWLAGVRDH